MKYHIDYKGEDLYIFLRAREEKHDVRLCVTGRQYDPTEIITCSTACRNDCIKTKLEDDLCQITGNMPITVSIINK